MRQWFVHAIPKSGYFPDEPHTVDVGLNVANKVVVGPFLDVFAASHFVDRKRPMQLWKSTSIVSRYVQPQSKRAFDKERRESI